MSGDDIPFTEEDLHDLYLWVDSIPISRPKKNIARDFSDGCSVAEILHHFFPKMVELHNYVPSMARARKMANWETLNARVLGKLFFAVSQDEMEDLVTAVPGAIERFLRALRIKISQIKTHQEALHHHNTFAIKEGKEHSQSSPNSSAAAIKKQRTAPSAHSALQMKNENRSRGHADGSSSARIAAREMGRSRADGRHSVRQALLTHPQSRHRNPVEMMDEDDMDDEELGDELVPAKAPGRREKKDNRKLHEGPSYGEQLLDEKGRTIAELKETVSILSEKVMKLEELLRIKDKKLSQYRSAYGRI